MSVSDSIRQIYLSVINFIIEFKVHLFTFESKDSDWVIERVEKLSCHSHFYLNCFSLMIMSRRFEAGKSRDKLWCNIVNFSWTKYKYKVVRSWATTANEKQLFSFVVSLALHARSFVRLKVVLRLVDSFTTFHFVWRCWIDVCQCVNMYQIADVWVSRLATRASVVLRSIAIETLENLLPVMF